MRMDRQAFLQEAAEQAAVLVPQADAALLRLLLEQAYDYVCDETRRAALERGDLGLVEELAFWRMHRLGSEGVASEQAGGVSQQFADGLPASILRQLRRRRKVVWS